MPVSGSDPVLSASKYAVVVNAVNVSGVVATLVPATTGVTANVPEATVVLPLVRPSRLARAGDVRLADTPKRATATAATLFGDVLTTSFLRRSVVRGRRDGLDLVERVGERCRKALHGV